MQPGESLMTVLKCLAPFVTFNAFPSTWQWKKLSLYSLLSLISRLFPSLDLPFSSVLPPETSEWQVSPLNCALHYWQTYTHISCTKLICGGSKNWHSHNNSCEGAWWRVERRAKCQGRMFNSTARDFIQKQAISIIQLLGFQGWDFSPGWRKPTFLTPMPEVKMPRPKAV